jgi:hypothetical protein
METINKVLFVLNDQYHRIIHDNDFDQQGFKVVIRKLQAEGYRFEKFTPFMDFSSYKLEPFEANLNRKVLLIRNERHYAYEHYQWMSDYMRCLQEIEDYLIREIILGRMEKGQMRFSYFEIEDEAALTIRFIPGGHSLDFLVYTEPCS